MGKQDLIEKYSCLIGQKINKWTVLEIVRMGKYDRPHAICQCECGEVKPVWVRNLIKQSSKDCGCGRKSMLRETRSKDLVEEKFGKLTVIELMDESNKFKRRLYRCKCDCGNEIIVPSSSLTTKHTSSCGCLLSYYNMYIAQLLDKKEIEYKQEYTVFMKNDKYYRYDFFLPNYNLFIEYDGQQHYMPAHFGNIGEEQAKLILERVKQHDKIKDQYCKENDINLLRIPYWEKDNIETIIDNHLQRLSEKGLV